MPAIPVAEIESLYERIRAFVQKRVENTADAEEIVQDIFLKMEEGLPSLREGGKLVPWLYQIARNRIIDHYRTRRIEAPEKDLPQQVEDAGAAEREELHACLRHFLETLDEGDRAILQLVEFENQTQRQAARRLGISPSAAKSRHQRAKKRLKRNLESCCTYLFDRRGRVIDHTPKKERCHQAGWRD